ncbi:MAG: glycosyltransferase family 2 protein [Saprospiraceae bacterium]|nr:glycosyltransferase family 2 protein [Saprospiraceae bacterium]
MATQVNVHVPMISIIIPVYNTHNSLKQLVERIIQTMNAVGENYEIILVNDHSPDPRTWETIKKLVASDKHNIGIQLTRNFGQQAATICGMYQALGQFVITMDDDLQHAPEDIPQLLEKRDHDIVIGEFPRKKHHFRKRIASKIKGYFDYYILDKPKNIQLTSFRLLNRSVIDGILSTKTPAPFIPALMFHVSKDICTVALEHYPRNEGKTGYTFYKQLKMFSHLIINNSSLLLRIMGQIGLIISLLSFAAIILIIIERWTNNTIIPGWTSTMVAVVFFGGIQMLGIGIIGEYLIRVIRNSEQRQPYHIKEIIKNDS